jgi:hypothetical protein
MSVIAGLRAANLAALGTFEALEGWLREGQESTPARAPIVIW